LICFCRPGHRRGRRRRPRQLYRPRPRPAARLARGGTRESNL